MPCAPVPASLEISPLPAHIEGTSLPLQTRQTARFRACADSGSDFTNLKPFDLQCRRDLSPAPSLLRSTADRQLFLYHLRRQGDHQKQSTRGSHLGSPPWPARLREAGFQADAGRSPAEMSAAEPQTGWIPGSPSLTCKLRIRREVSFLLLTPTGSYSSKKRFKIPTPEHGCVESGIQKAYFCHLEQQCRPRRGNAQALRMT